MMKGYRIDSTMRVFLSVPALLIWLGIFLTGFGTAHWVFYLPAGFFTFAVLTGICPGMLVAGKLTGKG